MDRPIYTRVYATKNCFSPTQSTIAHYQQKLRQLDDDIGKRRNERDEQKALVSERIKKAEGVCPRVRAKRTPQHLQQEIIQIEKRIATEEEAHGDKEVVLARLVPLWSSTE